MKNQAEIREGNFKTFEKVPEEFTFIASSCAKSKSNSVIFEEIHARNPDLYINLGDLHYSATNQSKKASFLYAYHEVFKAPR